MTNPPSVPSLDVEACVLLLREAADLFAERARSAEPWEAAASNLKSATMNVLALALPGMGKDSDEFREACRAGGIACAGEREAARDEGRLDDARRWGRFAEILHARVGANR